MILTLLQRPINSAVLSIASKNLIAFLESGPGVDRGVHSVHTCQLQHCTPTYTTANMPIGTPTNQPTNMPIGTIDQVKKISDICRCRALKDNSEGRNQQRHTLLLCQMISRANDFKLD